MMSTFILCIGSANADSFMYSSSTVDWVMLATIEVMVKDKVSHNHYTLLCAHRFPWPQCPSTNFSHNLQVSWLLSGFMYDDLHFVGYHNIANKVDAIRNCEASASNAIQVSNSKRNQNQQNSGTFLVSTEPTLISTLTTPIPPIQAVCHSVDQRCFMSRTHGEDNLMMRNLRGMSSVVSKEEVQDSS